jgi:putative Mg2+ transporter-C (MgtC) family protein
MLMPLFERLWLPYNPNVTITTDPTRTAQGIMTGIGFLGAGVIYKEGVNVRGLTTAASIWITAVIGILYGIGFFFPAIFSTALTLIILTVFRQIEDRIPTHTYAHVHVTFDRADRMPEAQLRALLTEHDFSVAHVSYRVTNGGSHFEYRMILRTLDPRNPTRLADALDQLPSVRDFRISPTAE